MQSHIHTDIVSNISIYHLDRFQLTIECYIAHWIILRQQWQHLGENFQETYFFEQREQWYKRMPHHCFMCENTAKVTKKFKLMG